MRSSSHLTSLLLLILITCCFAQSFKCSSNGRTCNALVDYAPPKDTTFEDVKNLFGVSSLLALRGANNLPLTYPRNSTVVANQKIRIPFRCTCTNGTGLSDRQPVYKVAANDSLYSIAAEVFANLATYQQIQEVNNISDPGLVKMGQMLWVPLPCSCDDVDREEVVHYGHVVAMGSTFGGIAQQFNVSLNTLLVLNRLDDPKDLKAGAILDVPLRACSSMVSSRSLDYPLLLPRDSYAHTATNCIICNCAASNNWILQCMPSPANSSCSPIRCQEEEEDNLYIGDTTSSGCNRTTCAYAGYTEKHILTTVALESTCPASSNESPPDMSSGVSDSKFLRVFIIYLLIFWCL